MGRLFFIFIIIIVANFVKKVLEAAKQSQQDQPETGSAEESIDSFLKQDEFLKAFQQKAQPVQKPENLLETISSQWQEIEEIPHVSLSEQPGYKEVQHRNFKQERKIAGWIEQETADFETNIRSIADVKIDLSSKNIQSAFVLKEILSPPVSLRPHDEGFLG